MDPTRPVSYKLLKFLLSHARQPFTQLDLHRKTGASLGQVNKVVRWLEERNMVEHRPLSDNGRTGIALVGIGGLLTLFAMARRLKPARQLNLSGGMEELSELIMGYGGLACLETALAAYSAFYRPVSLSFYHEHPEDLAAKLNPLSGGPLPVKIHAVDLSLENDILDGCTDRVRTVIDLACSNRLYAAQGLLKELWGLEIA